MVRNCSSQLPGQSLALTVRQHTRDFAGYACRDMVQDRKQHLPIEVIVQPVAHQRTAGGLSDPFTNVRDLLSDMRVLALLHGSGDVLGPQPKRIDTATRDHALGFKETKELLYRFEQRIDIQSLAPPAVKLNER